MTDTQPLQNALFELSIMIHDCRNNATFRPNEKEQLGLAFDRLTTRAMLLKIHEIHVEAQSEATLAAAQKQAELAKSLLEKAVRKGERRKAIDVTSETFDLIDPLLPEKAHAMLH